MAEIPYIHKVKEELRFARLAGDQEMIDYWKAELAQLRAEEEKQNDD